MNTSLVRNHDIERIYMKLLQQTETSVYYLHNKLEHTERRIRQLNTPIKKINDPSKPQFRNYFESGVFFFPVAIVTVFYLIIKMTLLQFDFLNWLLSGGLKFVKSLFSVVLVISIIAGIIGIIATVSDYKDYKSAQKEYEKKLAINKNANIKNIQQMKDNHTNAVRLTEHKSKIKLEYKKALKLRSDLYNINWIPSQYRNIRVVYYICDMVLTSNIGIEEALKYYLLQEANNKLDEVLQKMDKIIENQSEIIVNQAIMNAQNARIIQQNTSIISTAEQLEENTRLSAEYSQIGARYAEANAYFSLATYLKMK